MALLTDDERARVEAAIAEAEATTAGEIVVALVRRSDEYVLPRAVAALLTGIGILLAAYHLAPAVNVDWLLVSLVPVAGALYMLWGTRPLLRSVVPARLFDAAASLRARLVFAENGLHRTRDGSGVLVLVSELEHRVVILGDRGIDRVLGTQSWDAYVQTVTAAIRAGRAAEGLVEVVRSIGTRLAEHVPRRPDDVDELPNTIVDDRPT